jgi:integrase
MALTDTRLRTLKPPKGKTDFLVADGNGLYIRARVGQSMITKTWQFRRKEGGRLTIKTLGAYPELSIKDARLRAAELATKRSAYSPTVEEAANQWLRERINPTHKRAEIVRSHVENAIVPALGKKRVRDIEPAHIGDMVRIYRERASKSLRAKSQGRPAARALLASCKGLFGYCVARGWVSVSPAAQITQAIVGAPDKARERVLTDDEIRWVLTTDAREGPVLRFLLATGLRISEAYNGFRDGQYWVVPASASKNKREHRVWLSNLALAQLDGQPWKASPHVVQDFLLDNAKGFTPHDLRRTFSTRLNGMGVAPHIVERMLNHTLGGVLAIYNRAEYDAERRQALEAWSAWLKALVEKQPADVVPLRQLSQQVA